MFRLVALKVLAPTRADDSDMRLRLLREARAESGRNGSRSLEVLDHHHVRPVAHCLGEQDGLAIGRHSQTIKQHPIDVRQ